jgi:hypothetical protein
MLLLRWLDAPQNLDLQRTGQGSAGQRRAAQGSAGR